MVGVAVVQARKVSGADVLQGRVRRAVLGGGSVLVPALQRGVRLPERGVRARELREAALEIAPPVLAVQFGRRVQRLRVQVVQVREAGVVRVLQRGRGGSERPQLAQSVPGGGVRGLQGGVVQMGGSGPRQGSLGLMGALPGAGRAAVRRVVVRARDQFVGRLQLGDAAGLRASQAVLSGVFADARGQFLMVASGGVDVGGVGVRSGGVLGFGFLGHGYSSKGIKGGGAGLTWASGCRGGHSGRAGWCRRGRARRAGGPAGPRCTRGPGSWRLPSGRRARARGCCPPRSSARCP